jgi:ABC-2 type transport system permease protein
MNRFIQGVRVAAALEFRQRIRAGRWKWLLGGWFVLTFGITFLMFLALGDSDDGGAQMFGFLTYVVLGLLVLVAPSLTAQSINGERERGTLAVLQVTRLSAFEIAVGKLLAAWLTGSVFVVLLIPMALWCMAVGGLPLANVFAIYAVMILVVGSVCAMSLAMSALFKRSTTSTVLSYINVFALSALTAITFALAGTFVETSREVPQYSYEYTDGLPGQAERRQVGTMTATEPRTDILWWILTPNPFVLVADASPRIEEERDFSSDFDPLRSLGDQIRSLRSDPFADYYDNDGFNEFGTDDSKRGGAVWPWGILVNLLLAAGSLTIATRRLRTPVGKLPEGQRIA